MTIRRAIILYTIISFFLFLSSCIHLDYWREPPCDDDLKVYLNDFITEAKLRGYTFSPDEVVVHLGVADQSLAENDKEEIVGTCYETLATKPYVLIDRKAFARMGRTEREEIVYHELGHCLLGRDHITEQITVKTAHTADLIPKSIMNPIVVSPNIYEEHRDYYINELFNPEEIADSVLIFHYDPPTNNSCKFLNTCH